ncbi:hypothetical protein KR009_010607, partial [Drosophila setifemur]
AAPAPATATQRRQSLAARPTDRKRRLQAEDANNNNNNDDGPTPRIQQRLTLAGGLVHTAPVEDEGPAYCPLVRKTVASCPLPAKEKPKPKEKPKAKNKVLVTPRVLVKQEPKEQDEDDETEDDEDEEPQPSTSKAVVRKRSSSAGETKEPHKSNSIEVGRRLLLWVIHPVQVEEFFGKFWEKNACHVKRKKPQYFSELISFKMIDEMLIRHNLEFTTNIDVTSYTGGKRVTLNPEGRAMPPSVWGYYGDGCSIRILNPSTYLAGLRQVCSMMQEYFHCLVGANVYLTPPNSQGFAPHYDDIEAFVLQVEGKKRWRLYMPPKSSDVLARVSSGNYDQDQLGVPILEEVLEAGDVLYFPRGTVHQALTENSQHSLHITLSVYQQQSYANLLEQLMPMVLKKAAKENHSVRKGLPLTTFQELGLAHSSSKAPSRERIVMEIRRMVEKYLIPSESEIDAAVDQLAKKFQHEALPPTILPDEMVRTVFGSRSRTDAKGQCVKDYELTDATSVRLLRANVLRLVDDEGSLRVFFYVDNALEYCKYEPNFMEIEASEAAAVKMLIKAYPLYLKVGQLPLRTADRRVDVATALWERGLLMTEQPFK